MALLSVALPWSAAAQTTTSTKKEPLVTRVYMFGFALSLTDSTACQTEIQAIDSAWLEPSHKLLGDRALYSLQLQYHMESVEHRKNTLCTVYYSTSPRKLQRKWAKVKKRYEKAPAMKYRELPKERFAFKAEKYIAPIIGDDNPTQ